MQDVVPGYGEFRYIRVINRRKMINVENVGLNAGETNHEKLKKIQ